MKKAALLLTSLVLMCSCAADTAEAPGETTLYVIEPPVTTTVTETAAEIVPTQTTLPPVTYSTVSFTALGDNLIHSSLYNQAKRRYQADNEGDGYDFGYAYEGVADLLDDADITVLNQETLICNDKFAPSTYPCFNSPRALGDHMVELGVDVFTIANNHTLDKGIDGLTACFDYYDENGLVRVGAYRDASDRANIRTVEKNGVTVSFLCYTESLNGLSLPEDSPIEIGRCSDMELILSEIRAAKEISDICVVSLHWGTENSPVTEDYQRTAAGQMADAGADIIIGNHPHVLREIEMIECADGRQALCAYSLGNLISAQSVGTNLIGGILNFDVTVSSDENERNLVDNIDFIPIVTHYDANYANVRLYTLENYSPELASAHGVRAFSKFSYEYINDYLSQQGLTE